MSGSDFSLNVTDSSLIPIYRRLQGYAFDPSFANKLDAFRINTIVYPIRWEADLKPGPIGEYIEVIDVDPASGVFYPPVDLTDPKLMAQDGLPPSESNPQFHQQMVYAVAMTTIQNFEKALGRPIQWASAGYEQAGKLVNDEYVQRLRLYPHAMRDANAYYNSGKKAVLFGYFAAKPSNENVLMPGSLVFTCLSHDIICHEITHALIDGIYKGYVFPLHADTLALHEAFSDLVALFQHFTFIELLENQIARTRGNLKSQHLLSELAQQFGLAVGNYGALRDAIGGINENGEWQPTLPDPKRLHNETEPHARGSILVAAVFDAFLNIYHKRTSDLNRIASDGTGILPAGDIHPDLVKRLAYEASRTAKQFLSLCIRGLDYCPPIGTTFGDFLRALITADIDLVPNDPLGFRVAIIESFKRWGIYPEGIRTLSVDNLSHYPYTEADILELTIVQQNDRERQRGEIALPGSFLQKIDDLMLTISDLPSNASVFSVTDYSENLQLISHLKKVRRNILKNLASVKTQLESSLPLLNGRPYEGEIKVVKYKGELSLKATRGTEHSGSAVNKSSDVIGEDLELFLIKFWYLVEHYYNETAAFLTNRKRLFLISKEYKKRILDLFGGASQSCKERLQSLIGILLDENKCENFCKVDSSLSDELTRIGEGAGYGSASRQVKLSVTEIYPSKTKSKKLDIRIDSLHRTQRVGPDYNVLNQVVLTIIQQFLVEVEDTETNRKLPAYIYSGGCTLLVDIDRKTIRFIRKGLIDNTKREISLDKKRLAYELIRRYRPQISETASPFSPSRWPIADDSTNSTNLVEPFSLLHQSE